MLIVRLIIIVTFILVINVIPVKAVESVEFSGWSDEDEICISKEIELVNSRLEFNVLEGVTIYLLSPDNEYISCWSSFVCFGNVSYCDNSKVQGLIIHEIGHKVINDLGYVWEDMEFSLGYYVEGFVEGLSEDGFSDSYLTETRFFITRFFIQ